VREWTRKMIVILILLMGILSISACIPGGPHMTLLVNPKTGERVECRAATDPQGIVVIEQAKRINCVQQYEGLGFVQAQNLTSEQRDNLPAKPTR
jgi:hypothetical protein